MNANQPRLPVKTLVVILGPTGIGKSDVAIQLARRLGTEIISADSRQIFRDIPITTAAPSAEDLAIVPHHLIGQLPLDSYYSASLFERDALSILENIFRCKDYVIVCGGSMMYVDALCNGIDDIPTISQEVRKRVEDIGRQEGADGLLSRLKDVDPDYYNIVDRKNIKRVAHALEICYESGITYTSLRTGGKSVSRPFKIVKIGLNCDRALLFDRINSRVDKMVSQGMIDEARSVYHLRHLNSLNTVGFKEMFRYFDGEWNLPTALSRLQKHTRVYAKKQLTWFQRQSDIVWIDPTQFSDSASVADKIIEMLALTRC